MPVVEVITLYGAMSLGQPRRAALRVPSSVCMYVARQRIVSVPLLVLCCFLVVLLIGGFPVRLHSWQHQIN